MWTRSLLKNNAKEALRGRYWRSFLLCLLLSFLGIGDVSTNVVVQVRARRNTAPPQALSACWVGCISKAGTTAFRSCLKFSGTATTRISNPMYPTGALHRSQRVG